MVSSWWARKLSIYLRNACGRCLLGVVVKCRMIVVIVVVRRGSRWLSSSQSRRGRRLLSALLLLYYRSVRWRWDLAFPRQRSSLTTCLLRTERSSSLNKSSSSTLAIRQLHINLSNLLIGRLLIQRLSGLIMSLRYIDHLPCLELICLQ